MRIAQVSPLIESVPQGSVPEIIQHGVTGFIVEGIDEAVDTVHNIGSLSRESVPKRFDERFTIERVAHDYVRVYASLGAEPTVPVLPRRAA
jgi:glycosyltransferase involved in cell wall biosynthesis